MVGDKAVGPCEPNRVGQKVAVCRATGTWELLQDGCILQPIQDLLEQSQVTYSLSVQINHLFLITSDHSICHNLGIKEDLEPLSASALYTTPPDLCSALLL